MTAGGEDLNRKDAKAGTPERKEKQKNLAFVRPLVGSAFAVNSSLGRTVNTLQGDPPRDHIHEIG
jgi:hypothetical protein